MLTEFTNQKTINKHLLIRTYLLLISVLLIGIALRFYRLGSDNLWFDELVSFYLAKELANFPLFSFQRYASFEPNPPLYFLLLASWINLFGETEFVLRLPSTIFGVFSVFAIYKIGKLLFGIRVGLLSAFILSISPVHIWYAQEARGYTLVTFLVILTAYFLFLAFKMNKRYLWFLFVIFSVLSIYTSYHSFFIIPAGGLLIFITKYRHLIKRYLISCLFILIGLSPLIFIFLRQFESVKEIFWIPKPDLRSVIITFENFNIGYNGTPLTYLLSLIIFTAIFILGFFYLRKEKEKLLFLSSFLFAPILIIFLISQWIPIYMYRHLLAFSPFYYLFLGYGITKLKLNILKLGVVFAFIILASTSLYNYHSGYMLTHHIRFVGAYTKRPFRPTVQYVREKFREGDVVVHSNPQTFSAFVYYNGFKSDMYYFVIPQAQDKYWMERIEVLRLEGRSTHILDLSRGIGENKFKRIWLISSSWARDGSLDSNSYAVREWMGRNYRRLEEKWFDGILIGLYEYKDK